jgi:transposase
MTHSPFIGCERRVRRLSAYIAEALGVWRMKPVVEAYQALRGVSLIAAATVAAEVGDLTRFEDAGQRMDSLGLVPSEYSTGDHRKLGSITKSGNGHARRVLAGFLWAIARQVPIAG